MIYLCFFIRPIDQLNNIVNHEPVTASAVRVLSVAGVGRRR